MNSFHHWSSRLCALIALLMTVLGAANAVLRYVSKYIGVNLSSNAALELQWYLFSALFLLGAAYTLEQNRHVRVDVLHRLMSPKLKSWVELMGTCALLLPFCAFGIWSSWEFVLNSWGEWSSDAGGLPRFPVKVLIPIGFLMLFLQGTVHAKRQLSALRQLLDAERTGEFDDGAKP